MSLLLLLGTESVTVAGDSLTVARSLPTDGAVTLGIPPVVLPGSYTPIVSLRGSYTPIIELRGRAG